MLLYQILQLFSLLIQVYVWLLVLYALLSWVPQWYYGKFGRFLARLAEPYLSLFRGLRLQFFGLDFSIPLAIACLYAIRWFVFRVLGMIL